jgi:hypothetical protein
MITSGPSLLILCSPLLGPFPSCQACSACALGCARCRWRVGPFCHTLTSRRHTGPIGRPLSSRAQVPTRESSLCLVGPLHRVLRHHHLNRIAPRPKLSSTEFTACPQQTIPNPALISGSGRPWVSPSLAIKPCREPFSPPSEME